jgi:hypothetical protein
LITPFNLNSNMEKEVTHQVYSEIKCLDSLEDNHLKNLRIN